MTQKGQGHDVFLVVISRAHIFRILYISSQAAEYALCCGISMFPSYLINEQQLVQDLHNVVCASHQ